MLYEKRSYFIGGAFSALEHNGVMPSLRILYFASIADRLGKREERIDVVGEFNGAALKERIAQACPAIAPALKSCRIARNQKFVVDSEPFADGDEIAVIPPVSGG